MPVQSSENTAPATLDGLIKACRLEADRHGNLSGGIEHVFCKFGRDDDVPLPPSLPSIAHGDNVYFLLPADLDCPNYWGCPSPLLSLAVAKEGAVHIPREDFPEEDGPIFEAVNGYYHALDYARDARKARELLTRERNPNSGFYASAARIDETTPMLIEGLMRERSVSVIFGDFDEFKTTLVLDMMAHVAMGARWQGREVRARPVIWYALEGDDEMSPRVRALEASMKSKDPTWGADRAPITVRDRIPEEYKKWRVEISLLGKRGEHILEARELLGETPRITFEGGSYQPLYSVKLPVVVIDTLSLALGGDNEKEHHAVRFINNCLDLLKSRSDMGTDEYFDEEELEQWIKDHPDDTPDAGQPVASQVIIIHHQTKTGTDFGGHRAIGADSHGLYRVHRFGKITEANRPMAGILTPIRVKGMPRPAPIRFDVQVVPVEGTKQTAAILRDRATEIPKDLKPAIDALRELDNPEAITLEELKECLGDVPAVSGANEGAAKRKARQRCREKLETAGVIEPVEEDGKVAFYRFHDPGAV